MTDLRRVVRFATGWFDPGMMGTFLRVDGDLGSIQFIFLTGWSAALLSDRGYGPVVDLEARPAPPQAGDVSAHWDTPIDGGECIGQCDIRPGGHCYRMTHQLAPLLAQRLLGRLVADGDEPVFAVLETWYRQLAGEEPERDLLEAAEQFNQGGRGERQPDL